MNILAWLHKRSTKKRDRKYKQLDSAFDDCVAGLKPGDVAIDCGANLGLYTVRLASSGATVHAFEPNPYAFAELTRATAQFDNVELHQAAVTTEPGQVELYLHKWTNDDPVYWSSSSSLLVEKSNVRAEHSVSVEGIHLTQFIKDLGQPVKLFKMDVEGAEIDLLNQLLDEGLHNTIEQAFVEVHDRRVPSLVKPTQQLRDRLRQMGATHFRLDWR
jgi:FkbM family methyltransferase